MEIKLKNVNYLTNKQKINDSNLTIKKNQITSFVGPTGSGKTTIAKLISLLTRATSGEIDFDNQKITRKTTKEDLNKLRSQIGILYTEKQFTCKTVKEEIKHAITNSNYKPKNLEKRIQDSLKIIGLNTSYLNRTINSLSKGEQKKLAIAVMLSYNPKTIILDEPTLELDSNGKKQLLKIIKLMKLRYKKTIIIFSKDTDFVHSLSDYVYIINNGKVIEQGKKYDIFTNIELLKQNNLAIPKVIEFPYLVEKKKHVKIGYRDDINDLMKDIYRFVR